MENSKTKPLQSPFMGNIAAMQLRSKTLELEELVKREREKQIENAKTDIYRNLMTLLDEFDDEQSIDDRSILNHIRSLRSGYNSTDNPGAMFSDLFMSFSRKEVPMEMENSEDSDGEEERMGGISRKFKKIRLK